MLSELATHTQSRKDNLMIAHQYILKILVTTVKQFNAKKETPEEKIELPG
jgi:hypothetical protein